jgi:hypothetical protein
MFQDLVEQHINVADFSLTGGDPLTLPAVAPVNRALVVSTGDVSGVQVTLDVSTNVKYVVCSYECSVTAVGVANIQPFVRTYTDVAPATSVALSDNSARVLSEQSYISATRNLYTCRGRILIPVLPVTGDASQYVAFGFPLGSALAESDGHFTMRIYSNEASFFQPLK